MSLRRILVAELRFLARQFITLSIPREPATLLTVHRASPLR
jgi:hypothetical protein